MTEYIEQEAALEAFENTDADVYETMATDGGSSDAGA